jgi:Domain of unknown function (DUF4328)
VPAIGADPPRVGQAMFAWGLVCAVFVPPALTSGIKYVQSGNCIDSCPSGAIGLPGVLAVVGAVLLTVGWRRMRAAYSTSVPADPTQVLVPDMNVPPVPDMTAQWVALPPAPPPPTPAAPHPSGFRSGRMRAQWVIAALVVAIAAALWSIGGYVSRVRVVSRVLAGDSVSTGALNASDTLIRVALIMDAVAILLAVVAFVVWLHRAYVNAAQLSSMQMRFTPGWAVGWFFVPIANFYRPFQIVSDLWLASDRYWTWATPDPGSPPSLSRRIPLWWGLWLLGDASLLVPGLLFTVPFSLEDFRIGAVLGVAAHALMIVSFVATILVIRRIESRQALQAASVATSEANVQSVSPPSATAVSAAGRRRGPVWFAAVAVATAALVATPLVTAVLVTNGTLPATGQPAAGGGGPSAWLTSNAVYATCSDQMFKPGTALTSGLSSTCANVRLGSLLLGAQCNGPTLPDGVGGGAINADGSPSDLGSVKPTPQGCLLSAQSPGVTAAIIAADASGATEEPGDSVVVADLATSTNPSAISGLALRASSVSELDVAVRGGGGYQVSEITDTGSTTLLQGNLSDNPAVPGLNLGSTIRLVVTVNGNVASVYIDGRMIGSGQVSVPDGPGDVAFEVKTLDTGAPAAVTLHDLYIFASS